MEIEENINDPVVDSNSPYSGLNQLQIACVEDDPIRVYHLLMAGADYQVLDSRGRSVVEIAAIAGSTKVLASFLMRGFCSECTQRFFGIPSLVIPENILATSAISDEVITAAVDFDIDMKVINKKGETLLVRAIKNRLSLSSIEKIIKAGVDLDRRSRDRDTALDLAIEIYPEALPVILENGATIHGDRFMGVFTQLYSDGYGYSPIVLRELIRRKNYGVTGADVQVIIDGYLSSPRYGLVYDISDVVKIILNIAQSEVRSVNNRIIDLAKDTRKNSRAFLLMREISGRRFINKATIIQPNIQGWCKSMAELIGKMDPKIVLNLIEDANMTNHCGQEGLVDVLKVLALNHPGFKYADQIEIRSNDFVFLSRQKYLAVKTLALIRQSSEPPTVLWLIPNEILFDIIKHFAHETPDKPPEEPVEEAN